MMYKLSGNLLTLSSNLYTIQELISLTFLLTYCMVSLCCCGRSRLHVVLCVSLTFICFGYISANKSLNRFHLILQPKLLHESQEDCTNYYKVIVLFQANRRFFLTFLQDKIWSGLETRLTECYTVTGTVSKFSKLECKTQFTGVLLAQVIEDRWEQ